MQRDRKSKPRTQQHEPYRLPGWEERARLRSGSVVLIILGLIGTVVVFRGLTTGVIPVLMRFSDEVVMWSNAPGHFFFWTSMWSVFSAACLIGGWLLRSSQR